MKKGGSDKQKKMLGARERGKEDEREEREIKRGIEGIEVQERRVCYISLKIKITIGLALFKRLNLE